ncbi:MULTISPECIES: 2-hydroxychromene-2-carboxylate isomerase [Aquabacterium]|jgi:2-hydroxychromene-2-carboxylate isomerase|uniref:2-hydroxychromene-2-carboxylate isomerase n=1 Tax=Aquabacterium TaxID=92793 RepID=UPI00071900FC|nr:MULTISPECIES: 2-hydroxychromene-2-carboxylate isomerase [Aquabacterium]MBU0915331.1 2-hydroxychromene-2-carboxylate isomerase [Gammaproteobacteria bacterium]
MPAAIDFYFEFSSPYGYFAAERIEALAQRHGRTVDWHPLLLGVIFKSTGVLPLTQVPLKRDYVKRDWERISRLTGIPFKMPSVFPIASHHASRAVLFVARSNEQAAKDLTLALYRACYVEGQNIGEADVVCAVAKGIGLDADAIAEGMADPAVKDQLKHEVGAAEARGVFGSPFVIVDGEPFWGFDRFDMLEAWLERGGF